MTGEVLIFAGTTEGRELVNYCRKEGIMAEVVVATDYGKELIEESGGIRVSAGRLDEAHMVQKMQENAFDLVLDATHPYAREASDNIRRAAAETSVPYLRVCRRESDASDGIHVGSVEEAVEFLSHTKGNVLAVTGSKELSKYRKLADYRTRVYPRILPDAQTIMDCMELGFERKNLICMQGPFSQELNEAMLHQTNAQWMVTKEGGREGGFDEKMRAARQAGAQLIVVGRPSREEGYSLPQIYDYLKKFYHIGGSRHIALAGIGTGSEQMMTGAVKEAIVQADVCIGAERMLDCARGYSCQLWAGYQPDKVKAYLEEHPEFEHICILLSGDTGFYSGAAKLREALLPLDAHLTILPGISSLSYLASRLHVDYEQVCPVSLHGRTGNLVACVDSHPAVFVLLSGQDSVHAMCQELMEYGLSRVKIAVGQRLSYPDEQITVGTPEELVKDHFKDLCAALIENDDFDRHPAASIPDEAWIRGEVPMTKEEVRILSLSRLRLTEDSVLYDIGAGTGSVSVEAARRAHRGTVYAIEQKADAVELIRKNKKKFRTPNVETVYGKAPAAMEALPAPTHAFIGGSSGQLKEILTLLLEKNPKIHIVVNAITLETVAEMTRCCRELPLKDFAATLVQTARSRAVGSSHLMTGGNPVYIMSCQGDAKDGWQAKMQTTEEPGYLTEEDYGGDVESPDTKNGNEMWHTDEQGWVEDVSENAQEKSWNGGRFYGEKR